MALFCNFLNSISYCRSNECISRIAQQLSGSELTYEESKCLTQWSNCAINGSTCNAPSLCSSYGCNIPLPLPLETPTCVFQYLNEIWQQVFMTCPSNPNNSCNISGIAKNAGQSGCTQLNSGTDPDSLGYCWNTTLYNANESGDFKQLQDAITTCYRAAQTQFKSPQEPNS